MNRVFSIAALVIGGIIIADILIHPTGTATAFSGATQFATPTYSALLGGNNVQNATGPYAGLPLAA